MKKRAMSSPGREPKKRAAAGGYRLPEPIREGEVFTDLAKKSWKLGRSIGVGGFGEIYIASDEVNKPVGTDAQYVIKVEPHSNGPLFVEMIFYCRVAKLEMLNEWVAKSGLKVLGMPYYLGAGSHMYKGEKYRFLVLPRLGDDLQKLFLQHGRRFHIKTVLTIATYIMDILEYIHDHGYVHADIKGSNLMVGSQPTHAPLYLMDFGLACRYQDGDGKHKAYAKDARKAHNGTIEYTSRDAHIGANSRRGDLEILGYNLVQWLTGRLPWEDDLTDVEAVATLKRQAMSNVPHFLKCCFAPLQMQPPECMVEYLKHVSSLGFEATPNYKLCKKMFRTGIKEAGYVYDGKLSFQPQPPKKHASNKPSSENQTEPKLKKVNNVPNRQPCVAQNANRMTRHAASALPTLRSSSEFDWTAVLTGHPEKKKHKKELVKSRPPSALSRSDIAKLPTMLIDDSTSGSDSSTSEQLENPTPAMLEVLNRIKLRAKDTATHPKRASHSSSPKDIPSPMTPAMLQVLERRKSATRVTRSNSLKSKSSETITSTPSKRRHLNSRHK